MNKYQEALNFFKKVANRIPLKFANEKFCEEYDENIACIKELVDKETPKKVEKSKPLEEDSKIGRCTFKKGTTFLKYCPVCGDVIHKYYHKNYCGNCGQRIYSEG